MRPIAPTDKDRPKTRSANVSFHSINVNCPALSVSPATLPDGKTGAAYEAALSVSGSNGPFAWDVSGTLPTGLRLATTTGTSVLLQGTPTTAGTFIGQCTQYCGLYHSEMLFSVKIVTPTQFQQWLSTAQASQA